ncbi:MAG: hydroxysqualene dehydroxylase HpnE [Thermoguttaceae bacterium]|nr:hydroxysqualene dehydroxylase HpnE [Thermoguttaceae bacterium]
MALGKSDRVLRVAVIGGGVAGLAAAAALARNGVRVEVFEARRRLGGRAASFLDPISGRWIDHGQHVSMGCCICLADLCRRAGAAECFTLHRRLHFVTPDGRCHDFAAVGWLPAPLHLVPGVLRLGFLRMSERWRLMGTIRRLAHVGSSGDEPHEAIGPWLRRRQSAQAIERFWSPILTSALGESLDRASVAAAAQVVREGLLASRRAYELAIPTVALAELFDQRLGAWLAGQGAVIRRGVRVAQVEGDARRVAALVLADGTRLAFDAVVVAVPWWTVQRLLPPAMLAVLPGVADAARLEPSPITAIHLWFDQPVCRLPHAVLLDGVGQWLFSPPERARPGEHYAQVVISASRRLLGRDHEEVIGQVVRQISSLFSESQTTHPPRPAKLLRGRMVTERRAVFSVQPGVDALRPAQETALENLVLAGDWTATGWPATMEGAARSGYRAAEAILRRPGWRGCP